MAEETGARIAAGETSGPKKAAAASPELSFARVASGADQAGVRVYNERLALSLVRRYGPLSKIEVARLTGLSVQSTSAILNRLRADGLLRREAPLRGRVGQPTTPLSLDPDGAYSFGLKIGRRSCDLVLIDFCGAIRQRVRETYAYPTPRRVLNFAREALVTLTEPLAPAQKRRIAGLGVACPFQLWTWSSEIGAPAGAMDGWRDIAIDAEVAALTPYPVTLSNDATAACAAEFVIGRGWRHPSFLYFFVGAFVGGGLVLDGALYPGRTGNAAAVGSMPAPASARGGQPPQLIARASIYQLERRLEATGVDPSAIWRSPSAWPEYGAPLKAWIDDAGSALAYAAVAALSVIDVAAVVIDGAMPTKVRERLVARLNEVYRNLDRRGLSEAVIVEGSVGPDARAIGGACLPFIKNFARDREVLFKDAAAGGG